MKKREVRILNFSEAWSLYKILENVYKGEIKGNVIDVAMKVINLLPDPQMTVLLDLIYGSHLDTIVEDITPQELISDIVLFFHVNRISELFLFFVEITK